MKKSLSCASALLTVMFVVVPCIGGVPGAVFDPASAEHGAAIVTEQAPVVAEGLLVIVGKSVLVDSVLQIERISVGYGDIAEASAVGLHQVLLNGKAPGVTSLILWQRGGGKRLFDVTVRPSTFGASSRVEAIDRELKRELPGQNVEMSYQNDTVFLRGRVKDLVSAERAVSIASTLGRTVNLLYVDVPPAEAQVLLKVRFATIDRSASLELGLNLASTGAGNTIGGISTQQFSPPQITRGPNGTAATLSDALNIFLLRPDLNLLATIRALQRKSLLEILAEPNVLATNGKAASFLAGGEFPFPAFQPGSGGVGAVTIQFREFGVRLNFTPNITPRGTIRLQVTPEVSALDFTSGLVVQGFSVPALTIRKVSTEIELAPGQSFAIGGLLDNRLTETVAKLPVLGDLPVLGKLFQSKSRLKQNTELIIIVTPELVTPTLAGQPVPEPKYPLPLLPLPPLVPGSASAETGPPPQTILAAEMIPIETLIQSLADATTASAASAAPQVSRQTGSVAASPPVVPSR